MFCVLIFFFDSNLTFVELWSTFMFYHTTLFLSKACFTFYVFYVLLLLNPDLPFMFCVLILFFDPNLTFVEPWFTFYVLPYHFVLVYSLELSNQMFYTCLYIKHKTWEPYQQENTRGPKITKFCPKTTM